MSSIISHVRVSVGRADENMYRDAGGWVMSKFGRMGYVSVWAKRSCDYICGVVMSTDVVE